MKFSTRFSHAKGRSVVCTLEERRTKSEFAGDCDINGIMGRYLKTGVLPESARASAARYGDFTQVPTFQEMQAKIIAANELFAALPAAVRKQFDNDPSAFLAASQTSEGRDLMVKLGLGKAPAPASGALSSPQPAVPSAPAVQAEPAGTEPAAPSKKAGSK